MQENLNEKDLYPATERWLRANGCFTTASDTGLRQARIDAVGIKDVGGDLFGGTEVVGVEVKWGRTPFGNAVGQAHSYSVYADRCYLADWRGPRNSFAEEEVRIASHLGVGLLEITRDARGRTRIREVLTAPLGHPLPELRLSVVEKLGFSECTVCRSLFRRGDAERRGSFSKYVVRAGPRAQPLRRAGEAGRGYMYWLDEADERARARGENRERNYYRRYLCPDCVWNLFRDSGE